LPQRFVDEHAAMIAAIERPRHLRGPTASARPMPSRSWLQVQKLYQRATSRLDIAL
jgi:hypothetical protein